MLYREIIAVYAQIHTKHINTLCGQNVELLNVKPGGTYSDHWVLKVYSYIFLTVAIPFMNFEAVIINITLNYEQF